MKKQDLVSLKNEGKIGIYFLKEIWDYYNGLKHSNQDLRSVEWKYINGVFSALGIGIEPTIQYLMNSSAGFEDFETWIENNGRISESMIEYFNSTIDKESNEDFVLEAKVFNDEDLQQWSRDGYVILKEAISKEDCEETINLIFNKVGINIADNKTWYHSHPLKQGIMIQLFNEQILNKNRLSKRIRAAFEQLWNKNNLMVSMDRVSFNPPETKSYHFPGPNLHWDVSLKQPIPYGMQGLLYLTDTVEAQGAFTVIPGFHNIIDNWLKEIKTPPREINLLDYFTEKPIAAKAGDFIIWNHCLPHGSRPNHTAFPRIVQYINYLPLDMVFQEEWI